MTNSIVNTQLTNASKFWLSYPVPSVSASDGILKGRERGGIGGRGEERNRVEGRGGEGRGGESGRDEGKGGEESDTELTFYAARFNPVFVDSNDLMWRGYVLHVEERGRRT